MKKVVMTRTSRQKCLCYEVNRWGHLAGMEFDEASNGAVANGP